MSEQINEIFGRARELHRGGRLREARELYERVVRESVEHLEAWQFLGVVCYELGERDRAVEAAEAYREALRLNPKSAAAHNNLGNVLRDLGELEEAVAEFERALEIGI